MQWSLPSRCFCTCWIESHRTEGMGKDKVLSSPCLSSPEQLCPQSSLQQGLPFYHRLLWDSLCQPDFSQIHSNPPVSVPKHWPCKKNLPHPESSLFHNWLLYKLLWTQLLRAEACLPYWWQDCLCLVLYLALRVWSISVCWRMSMYCSLLVSEYIFKDELSAAQDGLQLAV